MRVRRRGKRMTTTYVNWGQGNVKLRWKPTDPCPHDELITSVHGFCFYEDQLLLVNLNDRGWDLPGGHIEVNESPLACFKREAMEEGYVEGECHFLGCVEVDHHENPKWNADSPYPIVGYQLFYRMEIKEMHPFIGEFEASERRLIHPKEVATYYEGWHEVYEAILQAATCSRSNSIIGVD